MHEEHASCARKECVSHLQGPALTPFSFPCSEIVDLTQDDKEKRKKKVVKEATRKKWVEKFPCIEWTCCMVLNQLHKKVSQIEIGRLEENFSCGRTEGFSNPLKFPGYELFTLFIKCARWLRKRG
jgi:hypothetical protein